MRVLMVLLALVATPFLVSVSQESAQGTQGDNQDCQNNASGDTNGDQQCSPQPPPPPAGPSISGTVFNSILGSGLSGWVIQLSGTVTAMATTDPLGNYAFTGLPDVGGTYTVCEVLQPLWRQTFPPTGTQCSLGTVGYPFTLPPGTSAAFLNFGNATP